MDTIASCSAARRAAELAARLVIPALMRWALAGFTAALSDLMWKKTEPPAVIAVTLVDDGRLRLTALQSSFIACVLDPPA